MLAHDALPVAPGAVALQGLPLRMRHIESHAVEPLPAPLSHPSPASSTPLPQRTATQISPRLATTAVGLIGASAICR